MPEKRLARDVLQPKCDGVQEEGCQDRWTVDRDSWGLDSKVPCWRWSKAEAVAGYFRELELFETEMERRGMENDSEKNELRVKGC